MCPSCCHRVPCVPSGSQRTQMSQSCLTEMDSFYGLNFSNQE
ncbi:MAG: hypothetical protein EOO14_04480 [Chitinophagaceae bacterium]|nr:MAG: hypothetical protein EOO14_04480 [Chitinophagaceae bacterium]